jgi:hypothetical protein
MDHVTNIHSFEYMFFRAHSQLDVLQNAPQKACVWQRRDG